jgi:excisionase family DNA binding protein
MSNILENVMTMQEAAQYIGITEGSIRNAIRNNRLKEGIDYKRSGRIIIVLKSAVEREWGRGK